MVSRALIGVAAILIATAALSAQAPADGLKDLRDRARTLSEKDGKHADALVLLDRAMVLLQRQHDFEQEAGIELQRATAYRALTERDRAVASATRARQLATRLSNPQLTVQSLIMLATLATENDDLRGAGALLAEAEPIAVRAGDERTLAALLDSLGRNARTLGRDEESIAYLNGAIEIADRVGEYSVAIRARGARSTAHLARGRFDEALADAQQGYEIAARHDPRRRATAGFALAQAHSHVWNLDRAVALWTEAIEAYRQINLPIGVALSLRQRMDTWFALGDMAKAAEDGEAALALFAKTGSAGAQPGLLARLALVEVRRGNLDASDRYAQQARATATTGPERRFIDNDLGLVALRRGDLDTAAARFDDVLARSRALGDPEYEWRAHLGQGRVALARQQALDARTHFEAAVALVERMRRELPEAGLRASFVSDRKMVYEGLVTAMLAPGSDAGAAGDALAIAERAHSRSLADLLAESQRRISDPRLESVRAEERAFSQRLSSLQQRIAAATESGRGPLLAELRQAENDYETLVVRVRRENPAYASLAYPEPLTASAVAALPAPDEALIEFLFDDNRGFAWIVRAGTVNSYAIPPAETLEPQIRLLGALVAAGDTEGVVQLGRKLHDVLLGPAHARLDGARRLTIVTAGPLHRLPFALLRTADNRWLFDAHAITLAPSATVIAEMRRRPPPSQAQPLLAFAAPAGSVSASATAVFAPGSLPAADLQYADAEARDAARLLGADAIEREGPKRTEEDAKQARGTYRVLHFATHAVIDEVVPRRSAILLGASQAQDGLLQINEIPNLPVQAELVVLAACRSHVGRVLDGEGLRGLSRAFMRAGSRAVVATLWEVDDAETRRLMRMFYEALRDGEPADRALAHAQRQMLAAGGRSANPLVWAAFIVTGDTSRPLFERRPAAPSWWMWAGVSLAAGLVLVIGFRTVRRATFRPNPPPIETR